MKNSSDKTDGGGVLGGMGCVLRFNEGQMSSRGREAAEGGCGGKRRSAPAPPQRGQSQVGPAAARANARCRIQGDGCAWLHSPQVAIAASLSLSLSISSFSWSPQLGGRDVIVRSCPCEEETDRTENFPSPGRHTKWVHP